MITGLWADLSTLDPGQPRVSHGFKIVYISVQMTRVPTLIVQGFLTATDRLYYQRES